MFGRSWKIGSVGGIPIRVDSSWAFIAILITYSLWLGFSDPANFPDISTATALSLAVGSSLLFFGSVLVHELAHAGMARARDIPVYGITLFMFGGATAARMDDRGAVDEFLVTAVGPASSIALGGAFWGLAQITEGPLSSALGNLGWWNFALGVFNLVPGFPLDGGRILRSIVWRVTGNLDRATTVAATLGMIVAAGLIGYGLWQMFDDQGSVISGVWIAFIGLFLFQGARGTLVSQRNQRALASGTVGDAMGPPPPAIPAEITLSESLRYLSGHEAEVFPVIEGDRLVGLLTFESARRVGQDDPLRSVRDALIPLEDARAVQVDDRLDRVAEEIEEGAALVLRDGQLVGAISAGHVLQWLNARGSRTP